MKTGQSNRIKNEIVNKLVKNDDLLKLLHYSNSKDDIYSLDSLTDEEKKKVRSENIYKRKRVPSSNHSEMKTYISLHYGKVGYQDRNGSNYYKDCRMCIYAITNEELDGILQGSRLDEIEDTINDIFTGADVKALKNCSVEFSDELQCPTGYVGRVIILRFADINKKIFE